MSLLHPHSFRGRVYLWIGTSTVLLTGLLLAMYSLLVCGNLIRHERSRLRHLAVGLLATLETQPLDRALLTVDNARDLIDASRGLACSIYRLGDSTPLYSLRATVPLDLAPPAPGERYRFDWDLRGYEDFVFRLRYEGSGYVIAMRQPMHTEAIERIFVPGAICMVFGVILALALSAWVNRKVVRPVRLIAATARDVRQGRLQARIPETGLDDEIQELIDTLNSTFHELEQNLQRIGQFSANAAHELRTPLTAIRGHFEVCLRRPRDVAEYQATIQAGIDQIAQLQEIVNALLLLSRPGRDRWEGEFQPVELTSLAADALQQLSAIGAQRQVRLTLDAPAPLHATAIPVFIRQLVYNLVHNAIKFSPEGAEVTVSIGPDGPRARLVVADCGCGIDPALHQRIFELFYQDEASRNQGVGLGLSLVKWIVDLHAGSIAVDSSPGQGARFTVLLPLDAAPASP